jgi:hypothetical protein
MSNFHMPIKEPKEIIPRLGKGELQWKVGRSAYELSTTWMRAAGVPASVRAVLQQAPEWQSIEFLEGIFERETGLPGRGRPSQTDLLAIVRLKGGNAILGVEGKVDEPFGPIVEDWLRGAPDEALAEEGSSKGAGDSNRKTRLEGLCATLMVDHGSVGKLYYQLFHRTCAAVYEAKRFGYARAAMLVHSFAAMPPRPAMPAGFAEFKAFAQALGMPVANPNAISPPKIYDGVEMRLAWISDQLSNPVAS